MPRRHARTSSSTSSSGPGNNDSSSSDQASLYNSLERLLSEEPRPRLVAFDLDYTLWPAWVDTHVDPPLKRHGERLNRVIDRHGQPLSFFPHVPAILLDLRRRGIKVAAASRTSAPSAARQALTGLVLEDDHSLSGSSPLPISNSFSSQRIPSKGPRRTSPSPPPGQAVAKQHIKSIGLFDFMEIYPGSKLSHFASIKRDSGVEYHDMVFFDDEYRNAEVERKLGVHFVEVGSEGLDLGTFERGIRAWREKVRKAGRGGGGGEGRGEGSL